MAARKTAAPAKPAKGRSKPAKVEKAVPTGQELAKWEEELANAADADEAIAKGMGVGNGIKSIGTSGGHFTVDDEDAGTVMRVIVLGQLIEHAFYTAGYDPDNREIPVCFAFGTDSEEMAPHDESEEKQNDICATCPMHQFGSADKGRGKACKQQYKLLVLPEDALENGIDESQARIMKVYVTSGKAWAPYVSNLAKVVRKPTWAVITEIEIKPGGNGTKAQHHMTFKRADDIEPQHYAELKARTATARDDLSRPFKRFEDDEDSKPQRGGRKAGGKGLAQRQKNTTPARKAPARRR